MNFFTRFIMWVFGIDKIVNSMKTIIANDKQLISTLSDKVYVPVEQPGKDDMKQFNEDMATISKNKSFSFYLMALETEILEAVRESRIDLYEKIHYQVRGSLQTIKKIRSDLSAAEKRGVEEKKVSEADILLSRLDNFIGSGVN
jgi:ABC-type microcin C transport system permease subunit YejE